MDLDKYDLKILRALDANARASFAELGKSVGLSKERVRYRFHSYLDSGFLLHTYALINYPLLDQQLYKIYLKLTSTTPDVETILFNFLRDELTMVNLFKCEGSFELSFLVLCKRPQEIYDAFMKLKFELGSLILRKEIHNVVYFQRNIFYDTKGTPLLIGKTHASRLDVLTPTRKYLLQRLSTDARLSGVSLAKEVLRTAKNVVQNISSLEENKIILGYGLYLDLTKLGWMKVTLNINLQDGYSSEKIIYFFQKRNLLRFAHFLNGFYDLSLELWFENIDSYRKTIIDFKQHCNTYYSYYDVLFVLEEHFYGFTPAFDD